MNILQEIFKDNYEQMVYILHPRASVIENVDKMASYFKVTGCSGMLQGVAPLKRMGVKLGFVLGAPDDDRVNYIGN